MNASKPRSPQSQSHAHSDGGGESPRLNTELHARLMVEGGAKPSTLESAREALRQLRLRRRVETLAAALSARQED